ncbi:MAG TPA: cytochrome c [Terracidiphilus sp.]|jgi:mono/diheme cytochrome c family protein|nr:cytochrome c [Terracidiphilus sp.]
MSETIRFRTLFIAFVLFFASLGFAQPGKATYDAKCQSCHGADGMASSGAGKILKVKPASDPAVKKMSDADMVAAVRNGMGKMQPYKNSLTDAQIKDAVDYFRTFVK